MSQLKCKHYSPMKLEARETCTNCYKRTGIQCIERLTLTRGYETTRKFTEVDRMMRDNRGAMIS